MQPNFVAPNALPMLTVRSIPDLEYLIMESEVLTGQAGRIFVIAGADWLIYRVQRHSAYIQIDRLDDRGDILNTYCQLPTEFSDDHLVEALRAGQLFTPQEALGADC